MRKSVYGQIFLLPHLKQNSPHGTDTVTPLLFRGTKGAPQTGKIRGKWNRVNTKHWKPWKWILGKQDSLFWWGQCLSVFPSHHLTSFLSSLKANTQPDTPGTPLYTKFGGYFPAIVSKLITVKGQRWYQKQGQHLELEAKIICTDKKFLFQIIQYFKNNDNPFHCGSSPADKQKP